MRISDWSSDVCSSDLVLAYAVRKLPFNVRASSAILHQIDPSLEEASINLGVSPTRTFVVLTVPLMLGGIVGGMILTWVTRSEEHTSELQSLMRISYAVFCLKKKK